MTKRLEGVQWGLLGGLALAAPLQGYSYVPYLDVSFSALLILAMLVLWMIGWQSNPVRMPWEYWWPALGVLAIAVWSGASWDTLPPLLAFVLTVQIVRSRLRAEYLMWLVSCSLGVFALCNAVAHQAGFLPTAHSLYSEATFVGAYSVSHGILLLIVGIVWGGYLAVFSKLNPGLRTSAFFSAFFCLGVLGGKLFLLRGHVYDWSASAVNSGSLAVIAAGLLLSWLVCRIAAKLWVTREAGTRALGLTLGGTALAAAVYWAIFPAHFAVYPGVLLGIAAGYALPDRVENAALPRFPYVPAVLTALLIVANVQEPYPFNDRDGRNVDVALERDWDAGALERVHRRATNLLLVYPERGVTLYGWMAEASLAMGLHERASKELAMAGGALDESTDAAIRERLDVALIELRDAVAQSDRANESFAYERALVGLGERGSALAVLKIKVDSGLAHLPETWDPEAKAFVYAALLGDVELEDEIAAWGSLQESVGDSLWEGIEPAAGIPAPLFWMVDRWPDRCVLYAVLGQRTDSSERAIRQEWIGVADVGREKTAFTVRVDDTPERAGWYIVESDGVEAASFLLDEGRLVRSILRETDLDDLPYAPVVRLHGVE